MKTANRIPRYRYLSDIAAALCIAVAASAQGQAPSDTDSATRVSKKLPKQRAAAVQAPMVRTRLAPAGVDRDFLLFDAATTETDPAELPVRTVEILDDATIARGGSRGLPVAQVPVFMQDNTCWRGHFMTDDNVYGLGTWASQMRFSCPTGFLCVDYGWQDGGAIAGYDLLFFCSSASANNCTVEVELWDGDPASIMETVCASSGVSAPIPGTKTSFSNLRRATHHTLKATLDPPVTYNCDRVWMVTTMTEGCRGAWLFGGDEDYWDCWHYPADIGWSDGYWAQFGCQQSGSCDTPSGYSAGTCCTTGEACDYTDADPTNWTGDCQEGGAWPPNCPGACWGFFTHPTFCSDGLADYYRAWSNGAPYGYYYSLVGSVYAATDTYIALLPVSADAPPEQNPTPDGWRISGNEIILEAGGRPVWLEIRIPDWDPRDSGQELRWYVATIDSSGYTSGLDGALTPYTLPCLTDADCEAVLGSGSVCEVPPDCLDWGMPCFHCNAWGMPCTCPAGFIDTSRTDYVFARSSGWPWVDLSTLDYQFGASHGSPPEDLEPFPAEGLYGGTLVLGVPADARGTFTVGILPSPYTNMRLYTGDLVELLGLIPAKITVEIGSCCYHLGGQKPPCVDGMTRSECDALPGPRVFTPGGSCADGCPEPGGCCLPDYSCEEMLPHQCAEQGGRAVDECLGDVDGNGRDDACLIEPVPTVSTWGLIIMALVLTVAAKVYFARRTAVSADK